MDSWDVLERECMDCRRCPLWERRRNVVFGTGDRGAEVLLIGEAPGEQEDRQGQPFVGRAGKLLDDMLELIDLDRSRVYIANMIKCRPPNNRDPLNQEQEACREWLDRQVALLRPRIIVCLGRIAATTWIRPDFKISREHGQWTVRSGVMTMALFHPASLLRNPGQRPGTFEDLKTLQQAIRDYCFHTY